MAVEVIMPKLGMAMKEGSVSEWNKKVGDLVQKGELIASINSEKIEMDIESPTEGMLLDIAVPEGEGVPPGTVICYIGNPNEVVAAKETQQEQSKPENELKEKINNQQPSILSISRAEERVKISPVARKMALAANLDIEKLQGTGPGGRITKEDVQEAMKKSKPGLKEKKEDVITPQQFVEKTEEIPVTGMRKVIATRMQSSLQNSAQLTLTMKADVTDLLKLQKEATEVIQKREENKLTVTDFVSRAVVLSLKEHQQMNSTYVDDKIHLFEHVHLGIAVALEKGLVVPVIRNAEACTIRQLSKKTKELAKKAREGQLISEDMKGSTFTISNLGAFDVEHFTPILNTPETGILGVGSTYDAPVYIGEELKRRTILPLSLTFDHRVLDGAPASAFLQNIKRYLEEPLTMLL